MHYSSVYSYYEGGAKNLLESIISRSFLDVCALRPVFRGFKEGKIQGYSIMAYRGFLVSMRLNYKLSITGEVSIYVNEIEVDR